MTLDDIDALLARMTLAEKAGQLNMLAWGLALTGSSGAGDATPQVRAGRVGSLINLVGAADVERLQRVAVEETRLGIPLFFGFDAIHGHRTLFPLPIAEAGAFDPELWERTARATAVEAAEDGQDITFAPMLDVSRDPRWGRACEGPGEDPWVAGCFARAKTRGFQGLALDAPDAVAGCAKHFCGYGAVLAGREYAPSDVSSQAVRDTYLPPFASAVGAGVATVMPSLNALNGVPMTCNAPLLQGWLRDRLGFDGLVISDYGAVRELINHGVAADVAGASALAIKAGCDVDMMGYAYVDHLAEAVRRGLCQTSDVDRCVRRVLVFKQRLGLFDDPYRRCRAARRSSHRPLAREAARRSIVLLTNSRETLPLAPGRQRIAVIGPLADAPREMVGSWAAKGDPATAVGVLAGLRAAYPQAAITHCAGVALRGGDAHGIREAVEIARAAEVVVLCVGEGATMNGEATSRSDLDLPGCQRELAEAVLAAGTPVIAVVFCGRPPVVPWLAEKASALVCAWMLGHEAGHALADVISGAAAPSGRLAMSWPRAMGQIPIYAGAAPNGRTFDPGDRFTSKYVDGGNEPLFPFGFGLATTRLLLGEPRADAGVLAPGRPVAVSVAVTNEGPRPGTATVFLFIRDPVASVVRPALELRGTANVALDVGASGDVGFTLRAEDASFAGADGEPVLEAGALDLLVGFSADAKGLRRLRIEVSAAGA